LHVWYAVAFHSFLCMRDSSSTGIILPPSFAKTAINPGFIATANAT